MIEKTRVKLRIVGSEFVVSADEDKDYIVKISNKVDEQIKEILRENDSMSIAMASILAALNYCDELEKEKIITEELLKRTETSENIASKTSSELEYLRTENKQLREEKLGLHKIIEELQASSSVDSDINNEPIEESPQQLRIPLPDADGEVIKDDETATQAQLPKQDAPAQPQPEKSTPQTEQTTQAVTEQEPPKAPASPAEPPQEKKPFLTARQMLEEKRQALLSQKNGQSGTGSKNHNRPKPFRPVSSAKSGGGAFAGNSKIDPKINYRDNDKISDSFRRTDFAEIPSEEDMLSFFDHR